MVWQIARKEFHDNWISHKIILAFALCVILMMVSVGLALKDYSERLMNYGVANSDDALFVGNVANYIFFNEDGGSYSTDIGDMVDTLGAYRRPAEFSVFARGLEDRMNRPVRFMDIRKMGLQVQADVGNKQERNKLFALFAPPDFLFITRVMLSLLTILFAFSAIAGERETGTLKLMLSNPVSRGQLLLGKFLGGYVSLAIPFVTAALISFILVALSPSATLNGEGWMRVSLLTLTSLIYIAVFFFIGLGISALARRSSTAVLLLLAIWIVLTLVVPSTGWLVAKRIVELPSEQQIATEKFKTARQMEDEAEKKNPSYSYMPGYGKYHIEAQPEIAKTMKGIEERYAAIRRKRLDLSQFLTRFSPVGSYVYVASGLTQTGIEDEKKYHLQLKQYENQVSVGNAELLQMIQKLMTTPPPQTQDLHELRNWKGKQLDVVFNKGKEIGAGASPDFKKASLSETLNIVRPDMLLLISWMALAFVFATLAVVKCEVR
ncbi:ABC transporter permease [Candidatus Poribacteria bacterium]